MNISIIILKKDGRPKALVLIGPTGTGRKENKKEIVLDERK